MTDAKRTDESYEAREVMRELVDALQAEVIELRAQLEMSQDETTVADEQAKAYRDALDEIRSLAVEALR